MRRLIRAFLWAGIGAGALLTGATANAQNGTRTVAVFDFELIDTSLQGEVEGVRPEETRRLVLSAEIQ